MEKRIKTYYDFAEDDYAFLLSCKREGFIHNAICYNAQNACEKYLKHLIASYVFSDDKMLVMKSHSLNAILKYIKKYLPEFTADGSVIKKADGFYFSSRYPGDDSFFVDETDIQDCFEAIEETKRAVDDFIKRRANEKENPYQLDLDSFDPEL